MTWVEVYAVFAVSHLIGDFLLQTEWQATRKFGGLGGDPEARRALVSHIVTYTLAFVPALIWLAGELGAGALLMAGVISLPHLVQDDGRLLSGYMRRVKRTDPRPGEYLFIFVDQSLHLVILFGAALVAAA